MENPKRGDECQHDKLPEPQKRHMRGEKGKKPSVPGSRSFSIYYNNNERPPKADSPTTTFSAAHLWTWSKSTFLSTELPPPPPLLFARKRSKIKHTHVKGVPRKILGLARITKRSNLLSSFRVQRNLIFYFGQDGRSIYYLLVNARTSNRKCRRVFQPSLSS